MTVPAIGTFQYYGVNFPADTSCTVSVRIHYDESDRTATHLVHTINASTTLTAASLINLLPEGQPGESGTPTDDVMTTIMNRLGQPQAALIFEGRGYTTLTCNGGAVDPDTNQFVNDVDFGPKPRIITWKPIGPAAAEVTWQCEVALPSCTGLVYQGVLLSLTYTQDFSVDHLGHCSRTTTGTITIPMTRQQDGALLGPATLPDTADNYWEDTFNRFIIPYWTRRTTNQRYLDYSKRVLRFRLVDTQMGQNMLPPNVSDMQASCSVSPVRKSGQQTIVGIYQLSFDATITLVRSVARSQVYQIFLDWLTTRTSFIYDAGFTIFPVHLNISEPDIFGNGPTGRISITFMMLQPLTSISANTWLTGTALWLTTNYTWEDWIASMQLGGVNTALGSAGLRAIESDDQLINVCNQPSNYYGGNFQYINVLFGGETAQFPVIQPDPATSWIDFSNKLIMDTDTGTIRHKLLPDGMTPVPDTNNGVNYQEETDGTYPTDLVDTYSGADSTDVIQSAMSPTVRFRLVGFAIRFAYDIPMPELVTFKGLVIKPSGNPYFSTEQIGNFGYPMNYAEWDISYDVPYSQSLNLYYVKNPRSPVPGNDVNNANDVTDDLQGDGIDDDGENTDFYEDLS